MERGKGCSRDEVKEVDGSQTMKDHLCPAKDCKFSTSNKMKTWNMF